MSNRESVALRAIGSVIWGVQPEHVTDSRIDAIRKGLEVPLAGLGVTTQVSFDGCSVEDAEFAEKVLRWVKIAELSSTLSTLHLRGLEAEYCITCGCDSEELTVLDFADDRADLTDVLARIDTLNVRWVNITDLNTGITFPARRGWHAF